MEFSFLIYDRFPVIRKGLSSIVSKEKPNSLVLISNTLEVFFEQLMTAKINLIIADITSEEIEVFELINLIIPFLNNENRFIFLVDDSLGFYDRKCKLISPYIIVLDKNSNEDIIRKKISDCYFHIEIIKLIKKNNCEKYFDIKVDKTLSKRELECAILMIAGYSNIEIAKSLSLSYTTISTYKKRVLQKTKTKNIVELISFFN